MSVPLHLTLRVENVARFDNGSPLSFDLTGRGAQVGRHARMDWVLPDDGVSGHHFDLLYQDGTYWVRDVSRHGTFLLGRRQRLQEPYRLQDGDRLGVGRLILRASLQAGQALATGALPGGAAKGPDAMSPTPSGESGEVRWDFGGAMGDPMWPPANPVAPGLGVATSGPPVAWPSGGRPAVGPVPSDPVSTEGKPAVPWGSEDFGGAAGGFSMVDFGGPARRPGHFGAPSAVSNPPGWPGVATPIPVPVPPAQIQRTGPSARALVEAFCEGAGLDPSRYQAVDEIVVMRQLGRAMKVASREIMRMLRDRAKFKEAIATGDRTILERRDNNPLKFAKEPSQAVEALFLREREGYLSGPEALEASLDDLRRHQMAFFGAMQAALVEVLDGLSPEDIESVTASGLFGGSSKERWANYVRNWEAKASQGENGMLDAFLRAFAKAYSEAASS